MSVDEAYSKFYENELIDSNHCGANIHHFLNYLEQENVFYSSGYVVSLHDDFGSLNHFDARWGDSESYEDGEAYIRDNWYFHVFVIIDGLAYDFSQRYTTDQLALDYLSTAYIPKKKTENIFFQGRLTPKEVRNSFLKVKMNIYSLDAYKLNYSGNIYQGVLEELFKYYEGSEVYLSNGFGDQFKTSFESQSFNPIYNSWDYLYPQIEKGGEKYFIIADTFKACRILGYPGGVPEQTVHEVSDGLTIFSAYSSLVDMGGWEHSISLNEMQTEGGIPNQPLLHYAQEISCTNLESVLDSLTQ